MGKLADRLIARCVDGRSQVEKALIQELRDSFSPAIRHRGERSYYLNGPP